MPKYSDFAAAVFDVDDTLLDNNVEGKNRGLHEQSRLIAAHTVGKRHKISALATFSVANNYMAFADAPVHSLEGAVWNTLLMTGQVNGAVIDSNNQLFKEIVQLKNELHEDVLRQKGREVTGAKHFVRLLASRGFANHLAIASTAVRRDALIALEIIGIKDLFPNDRIITKDKFTHPKPNPEAFTLAVASLGLDTMSSKILAFEDDPRGIMSAKAAGLYTCAITTRYSAKDLAALEITPDLIADSYSEFEKLLQL
jgi:beta-phosphoglucomutase